MRNSWSPRCASFLLLATMVFGGCAEADAPAPDELVEAGAEETADTAQESLPAGADAALARLNASPRHGEWVTIPAGSDSIRAWVVYPERSGPAPVVMVVHEIYGLTNWIRAVADQLAADGFVAIAPDLLTMRNIPTDSAGDPDRQRATSEIRELKRADVNRWLGAVADYGTGLPSTTERYGVIGFCWGGSTSFELAVVDPELGAAGVFYGSSPDTQALASIQAPVLGLYGGADDRVNSSIPDAEARMSELGRFYEPNIYDGAGHGFLRQQDGRDGANLAATRQAWPRTIQFLKEHLEG
ncbi:MAG: dienelactone hydrolase family protein [Gemmatimonadota bacterium]